MANSNSPGQPKLEDVLAAQIAARLERQALINAKSAATRKAKKKAAYDAAWEIERHAQYDALILKWAADEKAESLELEAWLETARLEFKAKKEAEREAEAEANSLYWKAQKQAEVEKKSRQSLINAKSAATRKAKRARGW
jgi:hypothetical protein